jgi:hypothetical protein
MDLGDTDDRQFSAYGNIGLELEDQMSVMVLVADDHAAFNWLFRSGDD